MLLPILFSILSGGNGVAPIVGHSSLDGYTNVAAQLGGRGLVSQRMDGESGVVPQLSGTVRVYPE